MLSKRLKNIKSVLKTFSGKDGEPKNNVEKYILQSMRILLCSEFEGSLKDSVENYIDKLKSKKDINSIHICLLIKNFYGNKEDEDRFTINQIISLYKKDINNINYSNFTKNKKATYKTFSVENLFNSLGIFFNDTENIKLKSLDSIASTRDSIAHGDIGVSITRKELEDSIIIIQDLYNMLKKKLK